MASHESNLIRSMVRGSYAMQKLRIQFGNRITGNFKAKCGFKADGMTEDQLEAQEKKVLKLLRESYKRITDGIVIEETELNPAIYGKLPTQKKFKGDSLISTYTELVLVDQYMSLLRDEEAQFKMLPKILSGIPVYDKFLADIVGIGNQLAGVIISEIDISRSEYPSSLWKYTGIDCVNVGFYTDDAGKEHTVRAETIDAYFAINGDEVTMLAEGKYPVLVKSVGRSRKDFCLVSREYTNKQGVSAVRDSITYNPFLKTKLVGVLGTSFLRAGVTFVDGVKMGAGVRLKHAKSMGFVEKDEDDDDKMSDRVIAFLRKKGCKVEFTPSYYGKFYYDYKERIENSPHHFDKTDLHRHNMAIRFMIKRFLVDLYKAWRALEGLPVAEEYSAAKLNMPHGKAVANKGQRAA